jgi:hypothetical protein
MISPMSRHVLRWPFLDEITHHRNHTNARLFVEFTRSKPTSCFEYRQSVLDFEHIPVNAANATNAPVASVPQQSVQAICRMLVDLITIPEYR